MYACHGYADHLAIDVLTSYFAAYALIEKLANEHLNFNLLLISPN